MELWQDIGSIFITPLRNTSMNSMKDETPKFIPNILEICVAASIFLIFFVGCSFRRHHCKYKCPSLKKRRKKNVLTLSKRNKMDIWDVENYEEPLLKDYENDFPRFIRQNDINYSQLYSDQDTKTSRIFEPSAPPLP